MATSAMRSARSLCHGSDWNWNEAMAMAMGTHARTLHITRVRHQRTHAFALRAHTHRSTLLQTSSCVENILSVHTVVPRLQPHISKKTPRFVTTGEKAEPRAPCLDCHLPPEPSAAPRLRSRAASCLLYATCKGNLQAEPSHIWALLTEAPSVHTTPLKRSSPSCL